MNQMLNIFRLAAERRRNRRRKRENHRYFQYSPLPDENHIRVLNLLPGADNDEVRCELATECFKDTTDTYEAISYVWGDSKNQTSIVCNDKILKLNVSLVGALRRLRDVRKPRRLWADALCINQNDDLEKGHQVRRMGRIYESAKAVIVWLGKDEDNYAEDCFNLIQTTVEHLVHQRGTVLGREIRNLHLISSGDPRWSMISKLTELDWFQRIWVVQEAALAKLCILTWGNHQMRYDYLIELSLWAAYRGEVSSIMGSEAKSALLTLAETFFETQSTYQLLPQSHDRPFINHIMKETANREPVFRDVLENCREKMASNPRDYIYAFLGNPLAVLGTEKARLIIDPDYNKPVKEVFYDFACSMLQIPREASILLSSVQYNTSDDFIHRSGPSWVPWWSQKRYQGSLASASTGHKAGGQQSGNGQLRISEHDRNLLCISGFTFDTLKWVAPVMRLSNLKTDPSRWQNEVRQTAHDHGIPLIDTLYRNCCDAAGYDVEQNNCFSMTLVQGWDGRVSAVQAHQPAYRSYLAAVRLLAQLHRGASSVTEITDHASVSDDDIDVIGQLKFEYNLSCSNNRRLAVTSKGRIGLFPKLAEANDICVLIPGCKTPYVLRKSSTDRYNLIGDCYVHGIMQGELLEELKHKNIQEEQLLVE
jgi:hypothetical protein